jgi:membrane protein
MAATATRTTARAQLPAALRELVRSFNERNLLTWASALSFQIVTAIVPFLLFGFGLIGFLHFDSVWTDIAKDLKPHMSPAAFKVVNQTADKVVHQKQAFWVTLGFALAIWEVSGGIRAIMGGLGEIYEVEENRSWFERMRRSIAIALIVSALVIAALAVAWLGPQIYGDVGQPLGAVLFLLRWAITAVLLGAATALTVRLAPDGYQTPGWVSCGTAIVVSAWVIASILFGLYVRYVASYGSIFGNLATIVILFGYVYISAIVFFAGAQIDAIIRRRVDGDPQGR